MLVHRGPLTMHLVVHSPMSQSGRNVNAGSPGSVNDAPSGTQPNVKSGRNVNAGSPGSVNDAPSGTQPNVTIWEECQCWFARVR